MNRSEAGKLGYKKSEIKIKQIREEKYKKAYKKYKTENPICKFCGKSLSYKKRKNKYCNHSCAASSNNKGLNRYHTDAIKLICVNCGLVIQGAGKKYCNNKCQKDYQWKQRCEKYEKFGKFIGQSNISTARAPKKYLIEKRGHQCEICEITEWQGQPVPLVFDHINGDAENWKLNNCRLVCGNCDMQLPTYKAKNKGNGRHSRRKRYREGKSF